MTQTLIEVLTADCNVAMQYELMLMLGAFLLTAGCLKSAGKLRIAWGAIFLFFVYIHRILLPFIVSGLYLTVLCGLVSMLISGSVRTFLKPFRYLYGKCIFYTDRRRLLYTAVILMILLIQLCRINIGIDYDSIRYGLRSDVLLAGGEGIKGFFTNTGLVNNVYTYPKGYELLTLPMYIGGTYGFVLCVNIWILIGIILIAGETVRLVIDSEQAESLAAMLIALVPGITNMSITAKSDLITLLCQLIFIYCVVRYVGGGTADIYASGCKAGLSGRQDMVTKSVSGAADIQSHTDASDTKQSALSAGVEHTAAQNKLGLSMSKSEFSLTGIGIGALILSYSFKQTAFVFSSFLGLATLIYFAARRIRLRFNAAGIRALIPAVIYTGIITLRTFLITGYPVTGVFSGVFESLGFKLNYPFRSMSLLGGEDDLGFKDKMVQLAGRISGVIICPTGEDMSHVFMCWGGIVCIIMLLVIICFMHNSMSRARELKALKELNGTGVRVSDEALCFMIVGFAASAAISLAALYFIYQVDGNYFMLFYALTVMTGVSIYTIGADYELSVLMKGAARRILSQSYRAAGALLSVVMIYFTAFTGWCGPIGFTEVDFLNRGYYAHSVLYDYPPIWSDDSRVVAFAYEPDCYKLNGRVESWVDIDGSGGNVYLTDTKLDIFKEYLSFADIDYIYADLDFLMDTEDSRHIRANTLFNYLLEDGCFTDIYLLENSSNRIVAELDKERLAVSWEEDMGAERTERTAGQAEWFGGVF